MTASRTPRVCLAGLALALALALAAAAAPAQSRAPLALTGVTVVDTVSGQRVPARTIYIDNGVIERVVPDEPPPAGVRTVDGRGTFVIPGLWDMHAHHEASGELSLPLYVANGVTGTRDMGSDLEFILRLRARVTSGEVLGPAIVLAGPILDDAPEGWPFRMRVRTADEARSAVGLLKARGVDFIKVHDRTPREAYFAIIEEAQRLQLPVMGHVPRSITLDEAIDAGQYDIAHLAGLRLVSECSGGGSYRPGDCRALFDRLARRGVWQTPTLYSGSELMAVGTDQSLVDPKQIEYASPSLRAIWSGNQGVSGVEPETVAGLRSAAATAAAVVADMQRAGVGILAGCDGMVPGFCVHDELALMVRGGMSPLAALQTATLNAARSFGREDAMGTVTAGRAADLVLLEGDPLADIRNLARIHAVVVNGRLLDRQQLDAILADVKRRAQP